MKNKKFIYIANSRVPTEKANGLQIIQNCEAFANAGLELELWIPQRKNTKKLSLIKNYWHYYGVKKNFIIKKFYCIDFLSYFQIEFFSRISYFLQYSTFFVSVFFYLIGK